MQECLEAYTLETLPPREARLIDPKQEKIPTPLDERGLIDVSHLIVDVKATVNQSYEWPPGLSVHHIYWPGFWYPYEKGDTRSPGTFRNLPIHKALVLRTFENWLHLVTLPPKIPEVEVMENQIEAWTVAKELFKAARKTVQWQRLARRRRELIAANPNIVDEGFNGEDIIGEEVMHEIFEKNFRGLETQLARQERIPAEFRLIDLETSPQRIARDLGKLVIPRSLQLVRAITN